MIRILRAVGFVIVTIGVVAFAGGCKHKDAKAELEKAADALAKADATQPQPAPATPPTLPGSGQLAETPAPGAGPAPVPPRQMMSQALASYKSGNFEDAVTRLQILRSTQTLNPQQRM